MATSTSSCGSHRRVALHLREGEMPPRYTCHYCAVPAGACFLVASNNNTSDGRQCCALEPRICSLRKSPHVRKWSHLTMYLLAFTKGRGLPFTFARSCLSTFRWARLATHRHMGPHSVWNPCSRQCNHRISVITKTRSKTRVFLRRLHIKALRFLCLTPFTSENHDPKNWCFSSHTVVICACCKACFPPRWAPLAM